MGIKISASLLSANYLELGEELARVKNAGCDFIHVDVMDGNYVENLAIGLCVAKWLPQGTDLRLDVHLAVNNPQFFIEPLAELGMHSFIFHPEAYPHHLRLIDEIRGRNMKPGIALSPSTSIDSLKFLLPEVDIVDQLSVDAGFPNQHYNERVNEKLTELKRLKIENDYKYEIHVDGGINEETAGIAADAGAEVLISGSSLFSSDDMLSTVEKLRGK